MRWVRASRLKSLREKGKKTGGKKNIFRLRVQRTGKRSRSRMDSSSARVEEAST